MEIDFLLQELKKTEDMEIRTRIAEEYPVDPKMDGIFQKSYQKYLNAAGQAPEKSKSFFKVTYLVGTAACLLFIASAYLLMDFPQQRLPSVRQETTTETKSAIHEATAASGQNAESDTAASTAQPVTETDYIWASSNDRTEQTDTVTVSAVTTAAEDDPVVHTTTMMIEDPTEPMETIHSVYPATTAVSDNSEQEGTNRITEPWLTEPTKPCSTEPTVLWPPEPTEPWPTEPTEPWQTEPTETRPIETEIQGTQTQVATGPAATDETVHVTLITDNTEPTETTTTAVSDDNFQQIHVVITRGRFTDIADCEAAALSSGILRSDDFFLCSPDHTTTTSTCIHRIMYPKQRVLYVSQERCFSCEALECIREDLIRERKIEE